MARLPALLLALSLSTAAVADPAPEALIAGARVAVATQRYARARATAVEAWRRAEAPRDRYAAARLAALSEAALGHDLRARLWLRRAAQNAPSPRAEASVAADYRYLRARAPLSVDLGFSVTPSDNLNNGTSRSTVDIGPFTAEFVGDALPLSGLEIVARADLSWRVARSRRSASFLTLGAETRSYRLSDEAQETAPEAEGSDYAAQVLTVGATHRWAARGDAVWRLEGRLGALRNSGDPYSRYAEAELGRGWSLGPADSLDVSLTLSLQSYEIAREPERSHEIAARWSHALPEAGAVALGGTLNRQDSDGIEQAYDGWSLSADWRFGAGANALHLGLEHRAYDDALFGGPPREDLRRSAGLDIGVPGISFYGFEPVVLIERARTDSTSARHDTEVTRIGLDIRSAF